MNKPTNGVITNNPSNLKGGVYEFDCLPGFVINGPERLTCKLNGKWNGKKPICQVDKTSNQLYFNDETKFKFRVFNQLVEVQ